MKKVARKKERNKAYFVVLVLIILVVLLVTIFSNKKGEILEEKELPVRVEVADVTGFKVDESLDFGRIIRGANGQKTIKIQNNYDFSVIVEFEANGDVKDLLAYEKIIRFEPGEEKNVKISTVVFENEPYGEYLGIMIVVFRKA